MFEVKERHCRHGWHGHRPHNHHEAGLGMPGDEHCPLCNRHCSLDEPGCEKGAAFTREGTDMREKFEPTSSIGLITTLHEIFRRIARARHEMGHAQHGQSRLLAVLAEKEPVSQRELLEELDIRSSSLSELLAKLEQRGLVERERDEADKRNFIVQLSAQGREASAQNTGAPHGTDAIFAGFSQGEREELARLLGKLNDGLNAFCPGGDDEPHGRGRMCGHFEHHGQRGPGGRRGRFGSR